MKASLFQCIIFTTVGLFGCILILSCEDGRNAYENKLRKHPYYLDLTRGGQSNQHTPDKPELSFERDFLMTMDPKLGYPTPEKLSSAFEKINEQRKSEASLRSISNNIQWVERGPQNTGGRTRALMWDPNDPNKKKVWAGGVTGGLWVNKDIFSASSPWTIVDNFWPNLSISCIASDPNNPQIFYVGTGEGWNVSASRGVGIWKSTDAGKSWDLLSSTNQFYYVNDLVVRNENGESVIYAGVSANTYRGFSPDIKSTGLQRSTDGGKSWVQVLPLIPDANSIYVASDLELGADNRLWVGTIKNKNQRGGATILYSDNGLEWTVATTRAEGSRTELACAPNDKNWIYAIIESNKSVRELVLSKDHGKTWSPISKPVDADPFIPANDFSRGMAWYDLILQVDPGDKRTVYVGTIDLFRSGDAGQNWKQLAHWTGGYGYPYIHSDQHEILFKPGSSSEAIIGNDGGVYLSTNINQEKPSFAKRNRNYNVTQFYTGSIHPTEGKHYFLAGSQDNGAQQFNLSGFGATREILSGDGGFNFIDPQSGLVQISAYVYNTYYLSRDGGYTFSSVFRDQSTGRFINVATYDANLGILYAYATEYSLARFYNMNSGIPYRSDTAVSLGSMAASIKISPYSEKESKLFVGTAAGRIFRIDQADTQPLQIEITGPEFSKGSISCIEIGKNENELLAIFSNYSVKSIWYTTDGGNTWADKEGDLPDMPVRWAVIYPNNENVVILATETGVWFTENFQTSTPNWKAINNGLANVRVDMLRIRPSDREVVAATFGRGLFSTSDFLQLDSSQLEAHFTTTTNQTEINKSVSFQDKSTGNPTHWYWQFEGGDPAISESQNPTITYPQPGVFSVKLSVKDDNQADSTISEQLIKVLPATSQPNMRGYNPATWASHIAVSSKMGDITNTARLSNTQEIFFSYSTINNGTKPVNRPFTSIVYIDSIPPEDSTLFKLDYNFSETNKLATGQPRSITDLSFDSIGAGYHKLNVFIDYYDSISEISEEDNLISYEFYVQSSCRTKQYFNQLQDTISDGSETDLYMPGLNCEWIISPPNALSINLSFDRIDIAAGDTLFIYPINQQENPVIKITGSSIPPAMSVETDSLVLRFSSDNDHFGEGWTLHYTTEAKLPDIAISNLTVEESIGTLTIKLDYENQSEVNMSSSCRIGYYWSADTLIDLSDQKLTSTTGSALTGWRKTSVQVLPAKLNLDHNNQYIIALADENDEILEKHKHNNITFGRHKLQVLGAESPSVRVAPVPAQDHFNIVGSNDVISYKLLDLSGNCVKQGNSKRIETKDLPNGVYLLKIQSGNQIINTRVIISH